jgi:hypothetical protein
MEIGLCWYKKGTNNKWTYDLTEHLMLDLETIMTLIFMSYMYINLGAYELHLGDEKCSTTLLMNARILHYTYDRGSLLCIMNPTFVCLC